MKKLVPLAGREEELSELFRFIVDELTRIRLKWRIYCALYGTNPERVALLNRVSGTTSLIIQDSLYDGVILHLCRLADPSKTRKNENNSVDRLVSLIAHVGDFHQSQILAERYRSACEPLKELRNRHIAHSDRKAKFANDMQAGVSRLQINAAIEALREFVIFSGMGIFETQYSTEVLSEFARDEIAFLRALYHGQERLDELEAMLREPHTRSANPRELPPEIRQILDLHSKPEWLNYRPPERHD